VRAIRDAVQVSCSTAMVQRTDELSGQTSTPDTPKQVSRIAHAATTTVYQQYDYYHTTTYCLI